MCVCVYVCVLVVCLCECANIISILSNNPEPKTSTTLAPPPIHSRAHTGPHTTWRQRGRWHKTKYPFTVQRPSITIKIHHDHHHDWPRPQSASPGRGHCAHPGDHHLLLPEVIRPPAHGEGVWLGRLVHVGGGHMLHPLRHGCPHRRSLWHRPVIHRHIC